MMMPSTFHWNVGCHSENLLTCIASLGYDITVVQTSRSGSWGVARTVEMRATPSGGRAGDSYVVLVEGLPEEADENDYRCALLLSSKVGIRFEPI